MSQITEDVTGVLEGRRDMRRAVKLTSTSNEIFTHVSLRLQLSITLVIGCCLLLKQADGGVRHEPPWSVKPRGCLIKQTSRPLQPRGVFVVFLFSRPKDQRLTGADMTTAPLHVSALRRGIRSSPPETTEGGKNKPEGRMLTRDVQIIEYINNISGEVKKESKVLMVWFDME